MSSSAQSAVLHAPPPARAPSAEPARQRPARRGAWRWPLALTALLAGALALRLWGIGHGLPYAYNVDENAHFVPRAIGLFGHDLNPHYFVNPPALTYLLHVVFAAWFGGGEGAGRAFAADPGTVFLVARVTVAIVSTAAVGLLYVAGARLLDRRVGLVAAGVLAVAFLPVFYAHLALNDALALAPAALSLVGAAGVLRHGRARDYALAGVGLGLACSTKYTAGIVFLPLVAAAALAPTPRRRAARNLALAIGAALVVALAANPYAVLDAPAFLSGLSHQAAASGVGKLGLTEGGGHRYYLWTLTWGLGWVPALAAVAGAAWLAARRPRVAALLVPAPVAFILYMGAQDRYFGRWLLPVLPILCLLAAAGAVALADALGRRGAPRGPALAVAAVALGAQGLLFSLHDDLVLSAPDTRAAARAWLADHVPRGTAIVVEPVVTDAWTSGWRALDPDRLAAATTGGSAAGALGTAAGAPRLPDGQPLQRVPRAAGVVGAEGYVRRLRPALLDSYTRAGVCWVVTGSTQSGRAFAAPDKVPGALAYYRALRRRASLAFRASPTGGGSAGAFNFDWSFDYYPLRYRRPGPVMSVYRLGGRGCGEAPARPLS